MKVVFYHLQRYALGDMLCRDEVLVVAKRPTTLSKTEGGVQHQIPTQEV